MARPQASYRGYRRDAYSRAGILPAWRRDSTVLRGRGRGEVWIHASLDQFEKAARAGKLRRR